MCGVGCFTLCSLCFTLRGIFGVMDSVGWVGCVMAFTIDAQKPEMGSFFSLSLLHPR